MQITKGDLTDPRIRDLLHIHRTRAHSETARGSAHSLDVTGLQAPDIELWAVWDGEVLLGVGALRRLSPDHAEIKSMHVAEAVRRKGVGSVMLQHIMTVAEEMGISRLSLETGSWDYFRPAQELYKKYGFVECLPFADYVPDPNSVFMTRYLR